jgi:hypothetical protein
MQFRPRNVLRSRQAGALEVGPAQHVDQPRRLGAPKPTGQLLDRDRAHGHQGCGASPIVALAGDPLQGQLRVQQHVAPDDRHSHALTEQQSSRSARLLFVLLGCVVRCVRTRSHAHREAEVTHAAAPSPGRCRSTCRRCRGRSGGAHHARAFDEAEVRPSTLMVLPALRATSRWSRASRSLGGRRRTPERPPRPL